MSSKYIDNGTYATSGYTLSGVFQSITIGTEGSIGGRGLIGGTMESYTVVNAGRLSGTKDAVSLQIGGAITNTGTGQIVGRYDGIFVEDGETTVVNAGTVESTLKGSADGSKTTQGIGICLGGFSTLTNETGGKVIAGGYFGIGVDLKNIATVTNSGTIEAVAKYGVAVSFVYGGGTLINRAGGLIKGYSDGIIAGQGYSIPYFDCTIINAGTIEATGTRGAGVYLDRDGTVSNLQGGVIDGIAFNGLNGSVINAGDTGDIEFGSRGKVTNEVGGLIRSIGIETYGSITNSGRVSNGIYLRYGGSVDNSVSGLITGGSGVSVEEGAVTLVNSGTIKATGTAYFDGAGLDLLTTYVSTLRNGRTGIIQGARAGIQTNGTCLVTNAGTIEGIMADALGIDISAGSVTNSTGGLIEGIGGVAFVNSGTVSNSGTIEGVSSGAYRGEFHYAHGGIYLAKGGLVTNSAMSLIEGNVGILANAGLSTIENAGTIRVPKNGESGVRLDQGGLVVNSTRASLITGYSDGVYLLGPGTVANFGTIEATQHSYGAAIRFNTSSDVLIDEAGSSFVGRVIGGGGTLELAGASGILNSLGTSFSGFGVVDILAGASWTATGTSVIASGTTSSLVDSGVLTVSGTSTIAGTVSGTGTLVLAGTETVASGAALSVAHLTLKGGALGVAGETLTLTGSAVFSGGTIAGSGSLGSGFVQTGGSVSLEALSLSGGAVLRDFETITASGRLTLGGSSRLTVENSGVFDLTGTAAIAGPAASLINAGTFEKTDAPGLGIIVPAFENDARVLADAGTLYLAGAVTGTGSATIGSVGTLEFAGTVAATQTIHFAATAGGDLVLDDPSGNGLGFAASIAGFEGSDRLDLASFTISGKPKLAWSQDGGSGTLTVTDGADVAKITLFGQYAAAGFKTAKDGGTGTVISYAGTPTAEAALANPHR